MVVMVRIRIGEPPAPLTLALSGLLPTALTSVTVIALWRLFLFTVQVTKCVNNRGTTRYMSIFCSYVLQKKRWERRLRVRGRVN